MRRPVLLFVVVLALAACTGDDAPEIGTGPVRSGEVVQTVAAPAELEPAARVTVTAPLGGEVAELLVGDGDVVEAGDPLVRLASDSIDLQVAQAEAALEAAEALAGAGTAGVDLSPLLRAFRGQFEAMFPPLLEALDQQIATLAAGDVVDDDALEAARDGLARAEQAYADARAQLQAAEAEARRQASSAAASQAAAAEAQREQAELALQAAQARIDDLTIVAPAAGVVELARAASRTGPDLDALGDDLEDGEAPDLGGLLGGAGDTQGPVAEGVPVAPGQPLLTIFDLSSFTVRVAVDELDVVQVDEGQLVTVLVDAFPQAELYGRVAYIALTPERSPAGGRTFSVTVELTDVPDDVGLRVGLTASAEIEVRRVDAETVVPTAALLRRGDDEVVYVVRDGIAVQTPVDVVAIGEDTAAVEGDLRAGEQVVTAGVELIEDGDEVPG